MLKKIVFFLSILFCLHSNAQIKEDFLFKRKDSLLNLYKKNGQLDSFAIIAHKLSIDFYKRRKYQKALFFAKKEVSCKNLINDSIYKNALFNLGFFYYKTNQYYKSNIAYKKVIDSFKADKKTYQSYCSIGRNFNYIGDFYQAINYYKKGLKKENSFSPKDFFNHYINLSIVYQNTDTKEGIKQKLLLLQKADSISKISKLEYSHYRSLYNNYGLLYKHNLMYNFNKSKYYNEKLIEKAKALNDTSTLISSYNNLGGLYNIEKNDSAYFYLNKGLKIASSKSKIFSKLQNNLAEYYYIKGHTIKALEHLHLGLQSTTSVPIDSSPLYTPSLSDFSTSNNKTQAFFTIKDKIDYILNDSITNKNKELVLIALKSAKLADQLLDVIKQESLETNSKLFWQEEASELYLFAVNACYRLNKPKQAFYFMEKNKAILLLENINENEVKAISNIPVAFLEKELKLKNKIYNLERALNTKNKSIINKYYNLKIEYKNLIESLKNEYPKYYNYKIKVSTIKIEETQNKIEDNTILVEYILNDKDGYVLVISKNKTILYQIDSITDLGTKIKTYLNLISKPLKTTLDLKHYNTLSKELLSTLLPFSKDSIIKNKNKLLIIPDYKLQYIPFETLKQDNRNKSILLEDFNISYAYSYSFLQKNKVINRKPNDYFIGFAPFEFDYDNLHTLKRSKTEINAIESIMQGKSLIGNAASKQNFFSEIKNYKIIHLSTHANANDSISPWIAFKDEKLFLNELYTVKNQAELVVLSTCNSSLGKLNKGEGVFSLARGFFFSGSNSVISSLWNVNDKSNEEIISSFYKYLSRGNSKSNSLRLAKLEYLKRHNLSEISPYYWSSLILVGDDSTISIKRKLRKKFMYITILFVLILVFLFFLKKKRT